MSVTPNLKSLAQPKQTSYVTQPASEIIMKNRIKLDHIVNTCDLEALTSFKAESGTFATKNFN